MNIQGREFFMKVTKRRIFYLLIIIMAVFLFIQTSNRIYKKRQEIASSPQIQVERIIPVQVTRVQRGEIKSFLTVSGCLPRSMTENQF